MRLCNVIQKTFFGSLLALFILIKKLITSSSCADIPNAFFTLNVFFSSFFFFFVVFELFEFRVLDNNYVVDIAFPVVIIQYNYDWDFDEVKKTRLVNVLETIRKKNERKKCSKNPMLNAMFFVKRKMQNKKLPILNLYAMKYIFR